MVERQELANEFVDQANTFYSPKKYEQAIELYPQYKVYKFVIGQMLLIKKKP